MRDNSHKWVLLQKNADTGNWMVKSALWACWLLVRLMLRFQSDPPSDPYRYWYPEPRITREEVEDKVLGKPNHQVPSL